MPILDLSTPLGQTASLTRLLRNRKEPLLEQLSQARTVFDNANNIHFPRKEEWLLEWLAERMREDDGRDGTESPACLSPDSWNTLHDLLQSSSCTPTTTSAILRKHRFLQFLSNALQIAVLKYTKKSNEEDFMDIDTSIQRELSETSSSHTETGSPIDTYGRKTGRQWYKSAQQGSTDDLRVLLIAIANTVASIQTLKRDTENSLVHGNRKRKIEKPTSVLKGTPEDGAEILGSFLTLLAVVTQSSNIQESSIDNSLLTFVAVWQSCIYGNASSKKLSSLVSKHMLVSSIFLLSSQTISTTTRGTIDALLFTYIFQPMNSAKEGLSDFKSLLSPLEATRSRYEPRYTSQVGPTLLRVALNPPSTQDLGQKQRKVSEDFCSTVFKALIATCVRVDDSKATLCSMLDIIGEAGCLINDEAIAMILQICMTQAQTLDCSILRRASELNTDAVLKFNNSQILDLIADPEIIDVRNDETWKMVNVLVAGYVKARNLSEFFERWRTGLSQGSQENVWNDDLLLGIVAPYIEKALNLSQIEQIIKQLSLSTSYSELVVMDCIIRGIAKTETVDKLRSNKHLITLIQFVQQRLLGTTSARRWKEWQVLLRILETWGLGSIQDHHLVLKDKATSLVKRTLEENSIGKDQFKAMFFSLQYLLNAEIYVLNTDKDYIQAIQYIPLVMERLQEVEEDEHWNGDLRFISTFKHFSVALLTTMMTRWTNLKNLLPQGSLLQVMQRFFHFVCKDDAEMPTTGISISDAWFDMLNRPATFESLELLDAAVTVLKDALVAFVLNEKSNVLSNLDIIISSLRLIPLEALRKFHREYLLDNLLDIIQKPQRCSGKQLLNVIRLTDTLMEIPSNAALIGSVVDDIHGLDRVFFDSTITTMNILAAKQSLGRQVLRHLLLNKDQDKARSSLVLILNSAHTRLKALSSKQYQYHSMNVLTHITTVVTECWLPLRADNLESMSSRVCTLRSEIIPILQKMVSQWKAEDTSSWHLDWVLSMLKSVFVLDMSNESQNEGVRNMVERIVKQHELLFDTTGIEFSGPNTRLAELQCLVSLNKIHVLQALAFCVILLEKDTFLKSMSSAIELMLRRVDVQTYDEVLHNIADTCLLTRSIVSDSYYQILQACINSSPRFKGSDAGERDQLTSMSSVYNQMCLGLPQILDFTAYLILTDCLSTSLNKRGWTVDQTNIDNTFACITATASLHGPTFNYPDPDNVYIPLCKVVGIILRIHRRRLSGRHHLMINVLQTLLRCLFIPKIQGRRKLDQAIHPPWIEDPYTKNRSMLSTKSAIAFNRLVTALCDPSSLSVTTNKKMTELSSSTVAARATISKHVPYIVLEFIQLSLTHRMTHEIRNALAPGLYAMFDVMGAEILRTVNAALDTQGRILFKALYDEWGKLGKWSE